MAMISEFKDMFDQWMAAVDKAVDTVAGRILRPRQILLCEGKDGILSAKAISGRKGPALPDVSFRLDKGKPSPPLPADWRTAFRGSRVEAMLQSDHVMFSPLDFPSQAGDFLDGMIRTQIDRLTPWTVNDAIFGWSQPTNTANDRIEVTFAATSKLKIQPLLQLAHALDIGSVAVFTTPSASEGESPHTGPTPAGHGANRLKNDESFQRGRPSRSATRSSILAMNRSNIPAAALSTGCSRSSDGAW